MLDLLIYKAKIALKDEKEQESHEPSVLGIDRRGKYAFYAATMLLMNNCGFKI